MFTYSDSHFHTSFSADSDTDPRLQIERAIELGMSSICITDHQDFDFPPSEGIFLFDTEDYFRTLSRLKEEYEDRIDIRIGVELGLQTGIPTDLTAYAKSHPFDFIIGSIHACENTDVYYPEYFEKFPDEASAFRRYFENSLENFKTYDCFDVAGHLDYAVRYAPNRNEFYEYKDYAEIIDEILRILIQKGKGIECNTAGLKAGLSHPHPTEEILKRYLELGGEILTLGSDAHVPMHLGYLFDHVGERLKTLGFRYYSVYKDRKPEFYPL